MSKILQAVEQLSPCKPQLLSPYTTTRVCALQWKILNDAMQIPRAGIKTWYSQINKYLLKTKKEKDCLWLSLSRPHLCCMGADHTEPAWFSINAGECSWVHWAVSSRYEELVALLFDQFWSIQPKWLDHTVKYVRNVSTTICGCFWQLFLRTQRK